MKSKHSPFALAWDLLIMCLMVWALVAWVRSWPSIPTPTAPPSHTEQEITAGIHAADPTLELSDRDKQLLREVSRAADSAR